MELGIIIFVFIALFNIYGLYEIRIGGWHDAIFIKNGVAKTYSADTQVMFVECTYEGQVIRLESSNGPSIIGDRYKPGDVLQILIGKDKRGLPSHFMTKYQFKRAVYTYCFIFAFLTFLLIWTMVLA